MLHLTVVMAFGCRKCVGAMEARVVGQADLSLPRFYSRQLDRVCFVLVTGTWSRWTVSSNTMSHPAEAL